MNLPFGFEPGVGVNVIPGLPVGPSIGVSLADAWRRLAGSPDTSSIDVLGLGQLSKEQLYNALLAQKVAAKYNLPEEAFIRHLFAEGSLKNDPGGNGGGISQFLATTAKDYGYTQKQLRDDPKLGIDLAARYIADNRRMLTPYAQTEDQLNQAAFASYFIGPGGIKTALQTGGANWIGKANELAVQYKQGSVSDYLGKRGMLGLGSAPKVPQPGTSMASGLQPPDLSKYIAELGDVDGYKSYLEAKRLYDSDRRQESADIAGYLDIVTNEIAQGIAAGNFDLKRADQAFTKRMDALTEANKTFTNLLKYTVPSTSIGGYLPGREPGGFYETKTGLKPSLTGEVNQVNPWAMANDVVNSTPDPMSIGIPGLDKLYQAGDQFRQANTLARQTRPTATPVTDMGQVTPALPNLGGWRQDTPGQ